MNAKDFKPTQEMITATETVFLAMAFTATIRPIVEGYQKKVLAEINPKSRFDDKAITDLNSTYEMHDSDFNVYLARCNEERIKAGLRVENIDHCPLLIAENLESKAKRALIEAMKPITNLDPQDVLCSGLENYEKLIDLSLGLMARFVDKDEILLSLKEA